MKYCGYDFDVDKGVITFDEELNAERFLSSHDFRDGQVCMFRVSNDGRLVLVCTDIQLNCSKGYACDYNPAQTVLPFDEL